MELAYGHVVTLDKAAKLGIFDAAEALTRQGPDKPWEVVMPVDVPVKLDGSGKDDPESDEDEDEDEGAPVAEHNVSLYRAMHHLNHGGLHRALGVPEGEDIPADKLEAAKNSKNEHVRRMASFAATMGKFHHGK